eukprot:scaffold98789_cov26-Attheya_sp.AAC.1
MDAFFASVVIVKQSISRLAPPVTLLTLPLLVFPPCFVAFLVLFPSLDSVKALGGELTGHSVKNSWILEDEFMNIEKALCTFGIV